MRVLSIDPGYERIGFAILEKETGAPCEIVLYSDCFKTSSTDPFPVRLELIGNEMKRIIDIHKPKACAIEKLFFNTNQKTAMSVSEVRGMLLFIAKTNNLSVHEYTPPQIKNAITGDGHCSKKQIISMIPKLVSIQKDIRYDDEYDAIAVGITFLAREKMESFLQNPSQK